FVFVFFFQAEDGIRDFHVTGVQTCALPISDRISIIRRGAIVETGSLSELRHLTRTTITAELAHDPGPLAALDGVHDLERTGDVRSEERRVGKEGRARGAPGE